MYEPFSLLFKALSHSLVGLDAPSIFLTNALLHSAVSLLAFALASALSSSSPSLLHSFYIFLGSAIFATHPLRTEVVAWLSCQPYMLASCLSLLSLLLYTPGLAPTPSTLRSRLSLLFYALALLSKSAAVPVVAIFILLDVFPSRNLLKTTLSSASKNAACILLSLGFAAKQLRSNTELGYTRTESLTPPQQLLAKRHSLSSYIALTLDL